MQVLSPLLQVLGSLLQVLGSLLQVLGPLIQVLGSLLQVLGALLQVPANRRLNGLITGLLMGDSVPPITLKSPTSSCGSDSTSITEILRFQNSSDSYVIALLL